VLLFSVVSLAIAAWAHTSPVFSKQPASGRASERYNPAAPYLLPLIVVVATGMVTGLFSTVAGTANYTPLYAIRLLTGGAAFLYFWREYRLGGPAAPGMAMLGGIVVLLVWIGVPVLVGPPAGKTAPPALSHGWLIFWIVSRALGAILLAPIVEELAFRGYLARRLMAAEFELVPLTNLSWPAILISSALFAAVHGHLIGGFVAGVVYAWVARYRGRLSDAILAHATTNALLTAYVLVTGAWALWG
jgi:CAAX prenyl protease-like protein